MFWISVTLSPLRRIRPRVNLFPVLTLTSWASSKTRFIYSSNPIINPSMRSFIFSKSQMLTRALDWRYLRNKTNYRILKWKRVFARTLKYLPENKVYRLDHNLLHPRCLEGHFDFIFSRKIISIPKIANGVLFQQTHDEILELGIMRVFSNMLTKTILCSENWSLIRRVASIKWAIEEAITLLTGRWFSSMKHVLDSVHMTRHETFA